MNISNTAWVEVGASSTSLLVDNVGETRIAYILADTAPTGITLDLAGDGEHGIIPQGSGPMTFSDLATPGMSLWVRSLGPKVGKLYVYAET